MALTGTHERTIDQKGRIAVPKRLRLQFSDGKSDPKTLYVTPEPQRSLGLYASESFDRLAADLASRTRNRDDVRNYMRLFYSQAEQVELDGQGRIRIPDRLIAHAGLKHDVMLLGVHDHAEIWDRRLWEEFLGAHGDEFDEMARRAFQGE